MAMNHKGSNRYAEGGSTSSGGKKRKISFLVVLAWLVALGALAFGTAVAGVLTYYSNQLPDFRQITDYKPSLITHVYDRQGEILAEYANERRVWIPFKEIPKPIVQAFLAAEDSHFYEHGGYDPKAIARAMVVNALTHRTQGASTITQQVAKTYLLSSERTYTRKVKELILSWRIEKAFSKNEILELYLNRIYLGNGSYGIAAAAQTYFSKNLNDLTIGERALIAGMPQAPSRYNPVKHPSAAKARRDIVIRRMQEENYITKAEADSAIAQPVVLNVSPLKQGEDAPHFAEYIRQMIAKQYGDQALYQDGLSVYTTLDLPMQRKAEQAVYNGLRAFDRRHGWHGVVTHIALKDWQSQMEKIADDHQQDWRIGEPAVVLKIGKDSARVGLSGGTEGILPASAIKWTGKASLTSLLKLGDVIMVKPDKAKSNGLPTFALEQIPSVQGALVAIDVRTGEVLAMVGGLGQGAGFNRATMAKRQLGSAFKPFVYTAALENNYTPATTILDAPVVFRMGENEWKPHNYDNKISGPTPLRVGLEKSKNLMTVRLAQDVGMKQVGDVTKRLGIPDAIPSTDLSVALGTVDLSLLDVVSAYSVFPRGGNYITPSFMRRVQDAQGVTLYRAHAACEGCLSQLGATPDKFPTVPKLNSRPAISPQVAYQMVSMMQGVVQRGTGYSLNTLGRPLAGKTGTTNDYVDAWFVGYSPDIAIGVWVGYDTPKSLGSGETGAHAALPIWKEFAEAAFKGMPVTDFAVPDGIEFVKIDADTGLLPGPATRRTLMEAFLTGTAPTQTSPANADNAYIEGLEDSEAPQYGGNAGFPSSGNGFAPPAPNRPAGQGGNPNGALDNLLKSFGIY
jgi:penicillin-binding protein 1A